jgi:hypothetical protein
MGMGLSGERSVQAAGRRILVCVALCRGERKWSTISLKKAGLVHDLGEKSDQEMT